MKVGLGDADAAVGIGLEVVSDFLAELIRIGKLPNRQEFTRDFGGQTYNVVVLIGPPTFEMVTAGPDAPRTRLHLTGTIEARPESDPAADPITLPLDAAVRLTVVLIPADPVAEIGFRYDGVDGTPAFPVNAEDIDAFMTSPEVQQVLDDTKLPIADSLVKGLNESKFPEPATRPADSDWSVQLTLTPASADTVDAFAVSAGPPSTLATLAVTESFVAPRTGLAVAYNRSFLDFVLARGAEARRSRHERRRRRRDHLAQHVDGRQRHPDRRPRRSGDRLAHHRRVARRGHRLRRRRHTPAHPRNDGMTMDTSGIVVDVDDFDEAFYGALKWVLTIGASALLFTGVGSLTLIGIALWATLVQVAWNKAADLDNAPNVLRDNLAASARRPAQPSRRLARRLHPGRRPHRRRDARPRSRRRGQHRPVRPGDHP